MPSSNSSNEENLHAPDSDNTSRHMDLKPTESSNPPLFGLPVSSSATPTAEAHTSQSAETSHAIPGAHTAIAPFINASSNFINRLPTELLAPIFRIVTNRDPLSSPPLLSVCRRWYRTIMGDALFWSIIEVDFSAGSDGKDISRLVAYVRAALERSRDAPLDITLIFSTFRGYCGEKRQVIDARIDSALVSVDLLRGVADSVAARWSSVTILLPYLDDGRLVKRITDRLVGVSAPSLRDVIIERGVPRRPMLDDNTLLVCGKNLRHLSTSFVDLRRMSLAPDSLHYIQAVVNGNWRGVLPVLGQSNLQHLEIMNRYDYPVSWEGGSAEEEQSSSNPSLMFWVEWLNTENSTSYVALGTLHLGGYFPPNLLSLLDLPVLHTLILHGEYPLTIFHYNQTFIRSLRFIQVLPLRRMEEYLCQRSERYREGLRKNLETLGQYRSPSLCTVRMPKCCVELAYPSLVAALNRISDLDAMSKVCVQFENGTPRLHV